MTVLHILLALGLLQVVSALLNLVSFLVVALLSERSLDLAHVEQLSGALELERQLLLQGETVLLEHFGVFVLEFEDLALVLLLGLLELHIPVAVELLVLLDVGVLNLLLLLLVVEQQLLVLHVELLLLQLRNSVLSHLSLCTGSDYSS
jgi:hypothetical protein